MEATKVRAAIGRNILTSESYRYPYLRAEYIASETIHSNLTEYRPASARSQTPSIRCVCKPIEPQVTQIRVVEKPMRLDGLRVGQKLEGRITSAATTTLVESFGYRALGATRNIFITLIDMNLSI